MQLKLLIIGFTYLNSSCVCSQDSYEELVMTVGSRRSGLNQNMALKEQYERALQDLTDLVDTAKDKMAADQRIVASSVEEVQNHLDKHKVWSTWELCSARKA